MTPLNRMSDGRCGECRYQYQQQQRKPYHKNGMCKKNLHRWIPQNWIVEKCGKVRCRPCKRAHARAYFKAHYIPKTRVLRVKLHISCVGKGCTRATTRSFDLPYICPRCRLDPPSWIRTLGLRIVGACILSPGQSIPKMRGVHDSRRTY